MTRSSMSRKPVSQAGKPGASPGRVATLSSASIEVMQQAFNLLSTEHSRGGGPLFWKLNRTSALGLFRKQIVPQPRDGEHVLRLPPVSFRLGRAVMHPSCKRDQAGASPAAGSSVSIFNGDHGVRVSTRLCESRGGGARPLGHPNFVCSSRARRSRRAIGLQIRVTRCKTGARVHFKGLD